MRFVLKADAGAVKIKIAYPNAGSYAVLANDVEIPYTAWDSAIGRPAQLTKLVGCGENRFVGVENFLEFYITTDCEIKIVPRDSISVAVRLDWTLDEFYADDGITTFVDRMAAALGVPASQIKVVAVYQGSVIVEYFVVTDPEDEAPQDTLDAVQAAFIDAIVNDTLDLGAPVLEATVVTVDEDGEECETADSVCGLKTECDNDECAVTCGNDDCYRKCNNKCDKGDK